MKLISVIFIIVTVALLREPLYLMFVLYLLVFLFMSSGVSLARVAKYYALMLPVITAQSASLFFFSGKLMAIVAFLKVSASVLAALYLVLSTEIHEILRALNYFGFTGRLTSMMMLTYRSIFLFSEENRRMKNARIARGFRQGKNFWDRHTMKTLSSSIGMLLIRVNRRSDSIYTAIRARGFDGRIRTLQRPAIHARDAALFVFILGITVTLLLADWRLVKWQIFV